MIRNSRPSFKDGELRPISLHRPRVQCLIAHNVAPMPIQSLRFSSTLVITTTGFGYGTTGKWPLFLSSILLMLGWLCGVPLLDRLPAKSHLVFDLMANRKNQVLRPCSRTAFLTLHVNDTVR